jgi:hypothetical protein
MRARQPIEVTVAADGHVGSPSDHALAVAKAAAEQVLATRIAALASAPKPNAWRFSGRSWGGSVTQRRERPTR